MEKYIGKVKFVLITLVVCIFALIFPKTEVNANVIEPTTEQKIKLVATELKTGTNGKQQLIVEMWLKDLNFQGMDIVLQYDSNILSTSDMTTNEIIDVNEAAFIPTSFEYANGFENYMDLFSMSFEAGELRTVISINPSDWWLADRNEYIIEDLVNGDTVSAKGEVLFGKLSFQVGEGQITEESIKLKSGSSSPQTGIKVSINGTDYYENPSMFEFVLALASENANLSNLQTDLKEITSFNKETLEYEIILEEDSEKIVVTPTPEDPTAIIKIGEDVVDPSLGYDVMLNPAGENTVITILVTAEDLVATKTYVITVKKPAGTITGNIITFNGQGIYSAPVKIYSKEQIANLTVVVNESTGETASFDWNTMKNHDAIDSIEPYKEFVINQDGTVKQDGETDEEYKARNGTYNEKIMIGTYDIIIDKPGYLDYIITNVVITENGIIEIGEKVLVPGDTNKDGTINLEDLVELNNRYGQNEETGDLYSIRYDITEDKVINVTDLIELNKNYGQIKEILNL